MIKRILKVALAAAMILNSISLVNAAKSCNPKIEEYTITDNVSMDVSRIEMGDTVNISIDIEDNNIKTEEISSAENITVSSVDGSFGTSDPDSVEITSEKGKSLEYRVKFKNVSYSGTGSSLSFKVKYRDFNLTSEKIALFISECSEKDTSDNVNTDGSRQPYIEIGRSNIEKPINSNEEFTIQLAVKNRGSVKMKRPVMTISLPDSINALENMGNIQLPDIEAGTSRNITLRLKAADYIQSASEVIDIVLSYNYESGANGLLSGSYSDRIFIPMKATKKSSAPIVQITRGSIKAPVKGNQEFVLPVTIKNTGSIAVLSPRLSISLPDELLLLDDSSAISLKNLSPNEEVTTSIRLKAKKYLTASTQEITAEVKYNYKSENEDVQTTESTKLLIPSQPDDDEGAEPLLHIVTDSVDKPLKGNKAFNINVTINNIGSTDLLAGVLTWDSGEGIILNGKSASVNIGSIKAGSSKTIALKGRTAEAVAAATQTITGELKYKYSNSKGTASGNETIKVVIPTEAEGESKTKNVTPNIIVNSYNYGGVPVANGNKFNFNVSFKNTSKSTPIENIVMTIETDTGVSITSASNTYYFEKLSALGVKGQQVEMQVLPTAETGSVKLTIGFKYEYVENGERNQVTSSQNVSIPVYKPDKLEITLEPLPIATAGSEQSINLNYVNKGKGDLSNVKAEITGDVTALTAVQNLGNFESGKSGTITFVVVPETAGEVNFTIRVSYEDANLEQKTLEFPCTMTVEEYVDDGMDISDDIPPEEEGSEHNAVKIAIPVGLVIIIIIAVIIIRRRKKKKANTIKVNWEDEDESSGLD